MYIELGQKQLLVAGEGNAKQQTNFATKSYMKNRNFKSSTQTKVVVKAGRKSFIHLISTEQLLLMEAKQ